VDRLHHVARARVAINLNTATATPQIVPWESGEGLYWIERAGSHQLHTGFADFAADLDARLTRGALVEHVLATRRYDNASVVIDAGFVSIALE